MSLQMCGWKLRYRAFRSDGGRGIKAPGRTEIAQLDAKALRPRAGWSFTLANVYYINEIFESNYA